MTVITVMFDNQSNHWVDDPQYSRLFLRTQQNWANDQLRARGHIFLNEIYDILSLPRTTQGQLEGWLYNGTKGDQVDFGCWNQASDTVAIELKFNTTGVIHDKI